MPSAKADREVFITGLGPITACGVGAEPLWESLAAGRPALRRIARFDPSGFACHVAGEIADELFDVRSVVPKSYRKATKVMARDIELAVAGAHAAVADAGLVTRAAERADAAPTLSPDRVGCHIGAGLIAAEIDELAAALASAQRPDGAFDSGIWGSAGMNNLTPLWLLKYLPNMLACHVTIIHDCQGPSNTITCAEASSGLSIGESLRVIQRGDADACLSGGAETKVHLMGLLRQEFAGRLVGRGGAVTEDVAADDAAQIASVRPFDPASGGSVLGEGGGILVLEASEVARSRGARAYAKIAGFGASQSVNPDTVGLVTEPDGASIAAAIDAALADAAVHADAVDAVIPFGSGIPAVDAGERAAIARTFGARTPSVPMVTIVPAVGNCCAGAGAVAVSVGALMLRHQMLPARLNSELTPGLDAVRAPSRSARLRTILIFTTSFGGQNAALVLRAPE
ncbi:MAG TPA: beta-ketoacyl synthase N-terminal-like domain-containing protein [Phycisphaerales bacterium]|nr:beta-ketoacyl synthase N-terminal-like domain-containing protein [Phycisphaerales bacterium]HMP37781.1 beta-ketoacyl synthase N-terminal-like domain-containing protein [Phycisphaerales bacterium]